MFDRQEDIIASTKRHPSIITIKSYLDGENRIIARDVDVKTDAGAYAGLSSIVLQRMIFSVCGVYNVENLMVSGKAYATNNIVTGAFRGFGGHRRSSPSKCIWSISHPFCIAIPWN